MKVVLVRHGAVEVEPGEPPSRWHLSDDGRAGVRALAEERLWRPVQRIFSSPEPKAMETAHIIAGPNGITVTAVEDLHEVMRPANQWIGDGYPAAVRAYFSAPEQATHGWEPPAAALRRMRACMDLLQAWEPDGFAVAGHGQSLSLYLASVTGHDPWEIWRSIGMPDVAELDPDRSRIMRPFGAWGGRMRR